MIKKAAFLFLLLCAVPAFAVEMTITAFRLNYLVYYHILYKLQGVPMGEFKNISVTSDTASKLVFSYDGKEYTANLFGGTGAIYVTMPEGQNNRYITQDRFTSIILSDYDK